MIYPALYNGPVQYFARLVREEEIILEQYDSYTKQSYRNRCRIMGPNGLMTLSIPVKRTRGTKTLFKDIRVDYDTPWNKIHWKSLLAAYTASPFFEYFRDELFPFYEKPYNFLVDLNADILEGTLLMMGLNIKLNKTEDFEDMGKVGDPRSFIHPKVDLLVTDPDFSPPHYHQVFQEKHGFSPNLSILDLLFNEGPASISILRASLKT